MNRGSLIVAVAALAWAAASAADSIEARCDVYSAGADHSERMLRCTFSQRQGHITIAREDGVTHDLSPNGDAPGTFRDQHGRAVYRESGLGDQGQIFRLPDERVYVYWSTAALASPDESEPAASTADPGELAGTSWRLVEILWMDDRREVPDDPSKYTLELAADGSAAIGADCNRGAGSWTSESAGKIEFGPLASTRAMCPPGSLSQEYLAQLAYVRSYVLKDHHLFLATMADGSILELEPLDEPPPAVAPGEPSDPPAR